MIRKCFECGKHMTEGYVIGDGEWYLCSDECLHKHVTPEEYMEMYENDEAYYTEWEWYECEDDDMEGSEQDAESCKDSD